MGAMNSIPYVKPSITEKDRQLVFQAATEAWGNGAYKFIQQFELEFAKFVGVDHAVATSSCTGALTLGLAALRIQPGDEVILAATNWVATLSPVVHSGATPVLVDVESDSWCIDPHKVEEAITSRTKAIIATHLYGNMADLEQLQALSSAHGIALIEDAAEAIGSRYNKSHAGSLGRFGTFSFHGSKTLTTGEGGMLVTNDSDLAVKVRELNNHGRASEETRQFWASDFGFKFKMTDFQAALGIAQLQRIDELVSRKQEILTTYRQAFESNAQISLNPIQSKVVSGAWMPNIVFSVESGITREHAVEEFKKSNIDARVFFWPLNQMFPHLSKKETPVAESLACRSINLPSFHDITKEETDRVINVVQVLTKSRS